LSRAGRPRYRDACCICRESRRGTKIPIIFATIALWETGLRSRRDTGRIVKISGALAIVAVTALMLVSAVLGRDGMAAVVSQESQGSTTGR